jgi:hypothetical protein
MRKVDAELLAPWLTPIVPEEWAARVKMDGEPEFAVITVSVVFTRRLIVDPDNHVIVAK